MMKKYGLSTKDNRKVKLNRLEVTGNICGEYIEYTISQDYKNISGENMEESIVSLCHPHPSSQVSK